MTKNITLTNDLPHLLEAVCDHPDCPKWLSLAIWDTVNDQVHNATFTANHWAASFESIEQGKEPELPFTARNFSDEMYKAIKGRICTPERMATLYPIFREINEETEEIIRNEKEFERQDSQALLM